LNPVRRRQTIDPQCNKRLAPWPGKKISTCSINILPSKAHRNGSCAPHAILSRKGEYLFKSIEYHGDQPFVRNKRHGFRRSAQMKDDMLAMIAASAMRKELSKTIMINLLAVTRRFRCSQMFYAGKWFFV